MNAVQISPEFVWIHGSALESKKLVKSSTKLAHTHMEGEHGLLPHNCSREADNAPVWNLAGSLGCSRNPEGLYRGEATWLQMSVLQQLSLWYPARNRLALGPQSSSISTNTL